MVVVAKLLLDVLVLTALIDGGIGLVRALVTRRAPH
jgi:hypothetical protein